MATEALGKVARQTKTYLVVGIIERDTQFGGGTLYCTMLYFGPNGELLGKHRKLKPTAAERLIWGEGDGSTLTAIDTEFGTVGGLICWENYMPLARITMYGKGVENHLAPTVNARDSWQATLRHIACIFQKTLAFSYPLLSGLNCLAITDNFSTNKVITCSSISGCWWVKV